MPTVPRSYHAEVLQTIRDAARYNKWFSAPLSLGGIAGEAGGSGVPVGGIYGQLIQTKVAYDTTELATPFTHSGGLESLVDNLNHIRWRLFSLEDVLPQSRYTITFEDVTDQVPGDTFTVANTPVSGSVMVHIDGVMQRPTYYVVDYDAKTITTDYTTVSGDEVLVEYLIDTGEPWAGLTIAEETTIKGSGVTALDFHGAFITVSGNAATIVITGSGLAAALDDLQDVVISSPGDNDLLAYDTGSSKWIDQTAAEAGISTVGHTHTESNITDLDHDAVAIRGIDVVTWAPTTSGQVLTYDGTVWGPETVSGVGGSHDPVTVQDTASIDLELTGQALSGYVIPGGVDHDQLLNFAANEHFTEGSIDHANIQSIGTTSHADIDAHIASGYIHTPSGHIHDDRYYTETEVDGLLHDSVTVVDTASLNLELTGQALSGYVIAGGINLGELGDVSVAGVSQGEVLTYDGGDWIPSGISAGTLDHGTLTGLDDDDHTQYLTSGRADDWFFNQSHTNLLDIGTTTHVDIDAHIASGYIHTPSGHIHDDRYYTETEVDGLLHSAVTVVDTASLNLELTGQALSGYVLDNSHSHTEANITDLDHDAIKLQGRNISSAAPADNYVLTWDAGNSWWEPAPPSGAASAGDSWITEDVTSQVPDAGDDFWLSNSIASGTLAVYYNGLLQQPTNYIETSASGFHTYFSPVTNDELVAQYLVADVSGGAVVGSVQVEKDDVVVEQRAHILNFEGSGLQNVVNDGSNKVTITISGGGVADHGLLAGLGDDDHTQYLTSGRADDWFFNQSHTNLQDIGTNTHPQLDAHVASGSIHFTESSISHLNIQDIGTNAHTAIDSHIADTSIHFDQLGEVSDVTIGGASQGEVLTYDGADWVSSGLGGIGHDPITVQDTASINLELTNQALSGYVINNSHTHIEANITDLEHDAVKLQGRTVASTAPDVNDSLVWNGSAWTPIAISGGVGVGTQSYLFEDLTSQVPAAGDNFWISNALMSGSLRVYYNGLIQQPTNYVETSASGFHTYFSPVTNDELFAEYLVDTVSGAAVVGTIQVEKDDAVIQSRVAVLNFEGSGVQSVTDEGSNKVTVTISGGGGTGDHGALTGLADDDHTQYGHLSQDETVNAYWTFNRRAKFTNPETATDILTISGGYVHVTDAQTGFDSPLELRGNQVNILGNNAVELAEFSPAAITFNDPGNDMDFRVESSADDYNLYVRGNDGFVGFGESDPQGKIHVAGTTVLSGSTNAYGNILVKTTARPTITEETVGTGPKVRLFPALPTNARADLTTNVNYTGSAWNLDDVAYPAGIYAQHDGEHYFYFAPSGTVDVTSTIVNLLKLGDTEAIFNDGGGDIRFRVEGNTEPYLLYADSTTDRVGIRTGSPTAFLDVYNDKDMTSGDPFTRHYQHDNAALLVDHYHYTLTGADPNIQYRFYNAKGDSVVPSGLTNNAALGTFAFYGYHTDSASFQNGINIHFRTDEDWTAGGATEATYIDFHATKDGSTSPTSFLRLSGATKATVVNWYGNQSIDFQVKGDTDDNLLYVDTSADKVGIGTNTPQELLHVDGDILSSGSAVRIVGTQPYLELTDIGGPAQTITVSGSTMIINEAGNDVDFRLEGLTDTNLLRTNAYYDSVSIGTTAVGGKLYLTGFPSNITNDVYLGAFTGTQSTVTSSSIVGMLVQPNLGASTGTQPNLYGMSLFTRDNGLANVTTMVGLNITADSGFADTIDDYYGIRIQDISKSTGTLTDHYAFYIEEATAAAITNNYAMVVEGGHVVFNENGGDYDFRVESLNTPYAAYMDGTYGRWGFGTNATNSYERFIIQHNTAGAGDNSRLVKRIYDYGAGGSINALTFQYAEGDEVVPSGISNFMEMGTIEFQGHDGTAFYTGASIDVHASEDWSSGNHGTYMVLRATTEGTAVAQDFIELRGDYGGAIGAVWVNPSQVDMDFQVRSDNVMDMFYVDASTDRIGIGISDPQTLVEMATSGTYAELTVGVQDTTNWRGRLTFQRARGSRGSESALATGDYIGEILAEGYNGSAYGQGFAIKVLASQTWTGSAYGTDVNWWFTPDGSTAAKKAIEYDASADTIYFNAAQNSVDFAVKGDNNNPVLAVDTANDFVRLFSRKTTTGDPTGVEGLFYYNTTDNVLKIYADGAWRTIITW